MKSRGEKSSGSRRHAKVGQPAPPPKRAGQRCPIVGVGASAGGLEAFTQLLKRLPVDPGLGFGLVQQLDPRHEINALTGAPTE